MKDAEVFESHHVSFKAFGGPCDIDFAGLKDATHLAQLALDEVRRIESKYSRYNPSSLIGQINDQAGLNWVACDAETIGLLDYAEQLSRISQGLFDITSGVLRRVWDFKNPALPSAEQLKQILPLIGWEMVERKGQAVRLKQVGMQLDFGGFGKEYAVDRVATILLENGVGRNDASKREKYSSALINFGGDVRALGVKPNGLAWQIGIQDPRQLDTCFATLALSQGALTTSGDYERYMALDGKRYCHIINPMTGQPVSYWRSVTVLAPLASAAGATSTIAMLREAQGLDFLRQSGFAYLAVDHTGAIFRSGA